MSVPIVFRGDDHRRSPAAPMASHPTVLRAVTLCRDAVPTEGGPRGRGYTKIDTKPDTVGCSEKRERVEKARRRECQACGRRAATAARRHLKKNG